MHTAAHIPATLPRTYPQLVELLPPRPLHHDHDYDEVARMVDKLALLPRRTAAQQDYLEALTRFIEDYDEEHHPTPDLPPTEMLRHLMEQHHMSVSALGRLLGDRSTASRVLKGERELSKAHIRILADYFGTSTDLFI